MLEVALGLRGVGKSTFLCSRARELQLEHGAYVVGHSLGARLPAQLPADLGAHKLPIRYHQNIEELDRGLYREPAAWHIVVGGPADPVIHYARALSVTLRRQAWNAAGKVEKWGPHRDMSGIRARPVIVLIDEGIAVDAADGKARGGADARWFREFLFGMRHENVILLWAIQNSSARTWLLVDQATAIHVFRTRHGWALECIRAAGANAEQIGRMRDLAVGERITVR